MPSRHTAASMGRQRVILAWEHGGNLGHLSRLSNIATVLRRQGVEPIWVVPPHALRAVAHMVRGQAERVLPAPTQRRLGAPGASGAGVSTSPRPRSFAGVLLNLGMGDAAALAAELSAWRDLAAGLNVAATVLDYAPTAMLAAMAFGWNAVQLSNGFDAPPMVGDAFDTSIRGPWLDQAIEQERRRVSASLLDACKTVPGARPVDWPVFVSGVPKWLDCLEETDPYSTRRRGEDAGQSFQYLGPIGMAPGVVDVPQWPFDSGDRPKVFAYLRGSPLAAALLRSLSDADVAVLCCNPDGRLAEASRGRENMLRVVTRPVDARAAFDSSDWVVGYGSSGFAAQAVLAGLPQLLVPFDLEKQMISRRISALGAGLMITSLEDIQPAADRALRGDCLSAANALSATYSETDWGGRLELAVSALIQAQQAG
jgi:hypothetical protein